MYSDNGTNPIDTPESPFPDPQSPTVPHLHRHRPSTDNINDPTAITGLRQRGMASSRSSSPEASSATSMRIHVQTPFSDLGESSTNGRRKELVVDRTLTVEGLKDGLAAGQWGDDGWLRTGMRLVWRGRIVRDEEVLGEIVRGIEETVHSFHLVARRSDSATPIQPRAQSTANRGAAAQVSDVSSAFTRPLSAPLVRATIAFHDSLHYLFFLARYHLCHLLDAPPLAWHDTVPPPLVEQATAQQAVMSIVRGIAQPRLTREEGWEGWERLFEDIQSLTPTTREERESQIKSLWSSRNGRPWREGDEGEDVAVELDEITYTLHLPTLRQISDKHLAHLLLYLRITALIPLLIPIIETESRMNSSPPAGPTVTRIIRAGALPQDARVLLRLRIPTIPMPVLVHMGYSAIKIAGMLWMLTRGMKWDDMRFWIMAGAAAGWWVADGFGAWHRARPRAVVRPNGQAAGGPAAGQGGAAGPGENGAEGIRATRNRAGQARPPTFASTTAAIPLLHLPTDSAQLGNPTATNSGQGTTTPVRRTPAWIQTQLVLPFLLWFITLIPEWETIRARAIRRRERAMRVVVGEATTTAARDTRSDNEEEGDEGVRQNVYPEGLNTVAKRYYERVMARGEGVDWEEEREAQRALGIPEEEEGGGDEMRMRML